MFNIVTYALVTNGAGSWLANGFRVAYRVTLCRKGANGELIESEPSDRLIVSNTSGSSGYVTIGFIDSQMMAPDTFFRYYRSTQVANGTDPSEELFLVAEL
ncbi:MAG: hypothetical protein E6J63_02125, partial [Deltaproteobacteria bacterium]